MDEEFCWREWTEELSEPSGADHERLAAAGEIKEGLKNIEACRYCNILPYDRTLARIAPFSTEREAPYINASNVVLEETPGKRYIISQAPRDNPVNFWRLILSNSVHTVVALAKIEHGYSGCSDYFPKDMGDAVRTWYNDSTKEYRVTVRLVEPPRCIALGVEERKFDVSQENLGVPEQPLVTKRVHHFHFTDWPNYGVPSTTKPVRMLVHSAMEQQSSKPHGSLLVHCSGGVGRSGVFLTLMTAMHNSLPESRVPSVVPIVSQLRSQRHPWCVETFEQYKFCYQTLMEEWDGWSPGGKSL